MCIHIAYIKQYVFDAITTFAVGRLASIAIALEL